SNSSVLGDSSANGGGSRWMGRYSAACTGPRPSIGSPRRVKTPPGVSLPTRTCTGLPGAGARQPRPRPSGVARGTPPDAVAAQVLLHLAGQADGHALVFRVDADGVVDLRQVALLELGVEGRADDLHDAAGFLAVHARGNHGNSVGRGSL